MEPTKPQRFKVYNQFKLLFDKYWTKPDTTRLEIITINMERAIFNYVFKKTEYARYWGKPFQFLYIDKAITMYRNLDPTSSLYSVSNDNIGKLNRNWLDLLLNEEITPHDLCSLSYTQLHPLVFENIKPDLSCMKNVMEIEDGFIQCISCKSYKTTYHEIQIRSSDESMDVMVTCTTCNYIWKLDN